MLIVTAAAEDGPVTRAEALAQLRILDEASLDTGQLGLIDDLIEEAVATVSGETGITLAPTGFEEWFCSGPGRCMALTASPVRDVTAVVYLDENGAEQEVPPEGWTWEPTSNGATVRLRSSYALPSLDPDSALPLRVRFVAGCNLPNGSDGDPRLDLPRPARTAVRLLIEAWFRNPASQGVMVDAAKDLANMPGVKVYR